MLRWIVIINLFCRINLQRTFVTSPLISHSSLRSFSETFSPKFSMITLQPPAPFGVPNLSRMERLATPLLPPFARPNIPTVFPALGLYGTFACRVWRATPLLRAAPPRVIK
jgi:hypothetical protein